MKIEQFEDKGLAQYSYAILSESTKEIVVIDPARDPSLYYEYADKNNASIVGVILTHSHADFVSSHAEIQRKTGAKIFVSSKLEAKFPHEKVDEGKIIDIGNIKLKSLNTPGHSYDSISVLLEYEGKDKALFTGDTLFIGDVGRPDLRGNGDNADKMRRDLAREMYHTVHKKLKSLSGDIVVYPGHGAGTLCGKSISADSSSTIAREIKENYAFKDRSEESFIEILLENQPFIPKYFSFDVALNKAGAQDVSESLNNLKRLKSPEEINGSDLIIDTRPTSDFKKGHLKGAINIQNGAKFETWLGSIVSSSQRFVLIAKDEAELAEVTRKSAKIGYEQNISGVLVLAVSTENQSALLNVSLFKEHTSDYTIIDIRNSEEVAQNEIFENSINIPLPELEAKIKQIPTEKAIVVHCAGGYRSAIGSSLLEKAFPKVKVYDLGEAVKEFQNVKA